MFFKLTRKNSQIYRITVSKVFFYPTLTYLNRFIRYQNLLELLILDMITRIRALWKPEMYHGWGRNRAFFEGWYFKLISADTTEAMAIIPGISLGDDPHAFIQVIDGAKGSGHYFRFDTTQFRASRKGFEVEVGNNRFSRRSLHLDLPDIQGTLQFTQTTPWPGTFLRPGVMGWYSFVPFMQCYHGLISMDHRIQGTLVSRKTSIDFSGGSGYSEKDWGSSFPKSWIWTQCNHYDHRGPLSVMASIAHIPWLSGAFVGFLALIWDGHTLKIFTTYTGAKCKVKLEDKDIVLDFSDKSSHLSIRAQKRDGIDLASPIKGNMVGRVNESIKAEHILSFRSDNGIEIKARGKCAGLEAGGNAQELIGK